MTTVRFGPTATFPIELHTSFKTVVKLKASLWRRTERVPGFDWRIP